MEEMDQCHHQSGWSGPWNTCLKSIFEKVLLKFNTKVHTKRSVTTLFGKVPFLHIFLFEPSKNSMKCDLAPGSPDVPMLARRLWCLKTKKCRPCGAKSGSSKSIMNLEDQKPHAIWGGTITDKTLPWLKCLSSERNLLKQQVAALTSINPPPARPMSPSSKSTRLSKAKDAKNLFQRFILMAWIRWQWWKAGIAFPF